MTEWYDRFHRLDEIDRIDDSDAKQTFNKSHLLNPTTYLNKNMF